MREGDLAAERYYVDLAAAFVRGRLTSVPDETDEEVVRYGLEAGLRLHGFKRTADRPRGRRRHTDYNE